MINHTDEIYWAITVFSWKRYFLNLRRIRIRCWGSPSGSSVVVVVAAVFPCCFRAFVAVNACLVSSASPSSAEYEWDDREFVWLTHESDFEFAALSKGWFNESLFACRSEFHFEIHECIDVRLLLKEILADNRLTIDQSIDEADLFFSFVNAKFIR